MSDCPVCPPGSAPHATQMAAANSRARDLAPAVTITIKKDGDKFVWDCDCGATSEMTWDYWETAEITALTHRNRKHTGKGFILGYELRVERFV